MQCIPPKCSSILFVWAFLAFSPPLVGEGWLLPGVICCLMFHVLRIFWSFSSLIVLFSWIIALLNFAFAWRWFGSVEDFHCYA